MTPIDFKCLASVASDLRDCIHLLDRLADRNPAHARRLTRLGSELCECKTAADALLAEVLTPEPAPDALPDPAQMAAS